MRCGGGSTKKDMSWTNKTKTAASWSDKTKTPTWGRTLKILTPNLNEILVGASEDKILIYQEAYDNWNYKTKVGA